jgi:hypothetical protein
MISRNMRSAGKQNLLMRDQGELYPWWVQSVAPNTVDGDITYETTHNCIRLVGYNGNAAASMGTGWSQGSRAYQWPDFYTAMLLLKCPGATDTGGEAFLFRIGNKNTSLNVLISASYVWVYNGTSWIQEFYIANAFINNWCYVWFDVTGDTAELSVWWWGKGGATISSNIALDTSGEVNWIRIAQEPHVSYRVTYIDDMILSRARIV